MSLAQHELRRCFTSDWSLCLHPGFLSRSTGTHEGCRWYDQEEFRVSTYFSYGSSTIWSTFVSMDLLTLLWNSRNNLTDLNDFIFYRKHFHVMTDFSSLPTKLLLLLLFFKSRNFVVLITHHFFVISQTLSCTYYYISLFTTWQKSNYMLCHSNQNNL